MQNPQAPFCVDYHTSFAPYIQTIKQLIKDKYTPIMINYRLNAVSDNAHLINTYNSAGSIIGQASYIFDLFHYLTNAEAVSVSVESLKPTSDEIFPTDNFSATITFNDGSVCTLFYTTLGHKSLSQERMELFVDSKAIVMEDYKTLKMHGFSKSYNQRTNSPDKGHEYLLKQFFANIQKETFESPIPLKRMLDVANLSLVIDQLVCQGGGEQSL